MSTVAAHDQSTSWGAKPPVTMRAHQSAPAILAAADLGRERRAAQANLGAMLARLLDDASEAIHRDRETAQACIARASALLEFERGRDRAGSEGAASTLVQGGLAPWQIARVKSHIEANLDSTIRMTDLTAIVRLSAGHFTRSFKRSFGEAPFAYIVGRRLVRAQDLMLTTEESFCQIALACGLCDQSHLSRLFRQRFGTSPSNWRRLHRDAPDAPLPSSRMPIDGFAPSRFAPRPSTGLQLNPCPLPKSRSI